MSGPVPCWTAVTNAAWPSAVIVWRRTFAPARSGASTNLIRMAPPTVPTSRLFPRRGGNCENSTLSVFTPGSIGGVDDRPAPIQFRLLGPIEVWRGDRPVAIGGPRPKTLLTMLLLRRGETVPTEQIVDALFADDPRVGSVATTHTYVCRLRKALGGGADLLRTSGRGYGLHVAPDAVDIDRFGRLLEAGQRAAEAGAWQQSAEHFGAGLELWHGDALADARDLPFAQPEVARLEELRLVAVEGRCAAELALGRHAGLVGPLERLVALHPLREGLSGQLMLALYRCQRQADAMAAYARLRRTLADELGIEPAPPLRRLHQAILRQEAELGPPPALASPALASPAPAIAAPVPPAPVLPAPAAPVDPVTVPAVPEAVPAAGPLCRLPDRQPGFVGREAVLARVREALAGATGRGAVALCGLGGVGKTQVAVEYAHRHGDGYDVVWWVPAEDRVGLAAALAELGPALGVPATDDREALVDEVVRRLAKRRWLLVFDNAEHVDDVCRYLPGGTGDVIVTSRNPAWRRIAVPLAVPVFSRDESLALLSGRDAAGGDPAAGRVAELLGDLPLALVQAAAYADETGMEYDAYATLFRRRRDALLARGTPGDHLGVDTTWRLALDRVTAAAPAAAELLRLLAFLGADGIDLALLTRRAAHLPPDLAAAAGEEVGLNDTVGALLRYSLVERRGDRIATHRLVQAVVRSALPAERQRAWLATAADLLVRERPADERDPGTWAAWDAVLPHLLAVGERIEEIGAVGAGGEPLGEVLPDLVDLLGAAGRYLTRRAAFDPARRLLEQAVRLAEPAGGARPLPLADLLADLGETRERAGDLDGARAVLQRALGLFEAGPGLDTPVAAETLSRLGNTFTRLGQLARAVEALRRSCAILAAHPVADPQLAAAATRLGWALWLTSDLDAAREAFSRALALLGDAAAATPESAQARSGLGLVLQDAGDLDGALACHRRAWVTLSTVYGAGHPESAHARDRLGFALGLRGDLAAARACHEAAVAALAEAYGPDHPEPAVARANLGLILHRLGDLDGALDCQRHALDVLAGTCGWAHPHTHIAARRLAAVLAERGAVEPARELLERVLDEAIATQGPGHPDVRLTRDQLADTAALAHPRDLADIRL
jgi:DNA-binding SARP family transcriptional activator/tetratricopeptide (TPR) repeat protein